MLERAVTISPKERVEKFPGNNLVVQNFKLLLFCLAYGNVDAVIDGIVENQENAAQQRSRLKAYTLRVTLTGFNFFCSKFDPEHGKIN